MNQDKARLRAMQAIGKLLPADESGKMEERAIKGYIALLETELTGYQERERQQQAQMARIEKKQVDTLASIAEIKDRLASMSQPDESDTP